MLPVGLAAVFEPLPPHPATAIARIAIAASFATQNTATGAEATTFPTPTASNEKVPRKKK